MIVPPKGKTDGALWRERRPALGRLREQARIRLVRGEHPLETRRWLANWIHESVARCAREALRSGPPVPEKAAVFVTGSVASRQAGVTSDVDHGIVLEEGSLEGQRWARDFGERFEQGLAALGMPLCDLYRTGGALPLIGRPVELMHSSFGEQPHALARSRLLVGDASLARALQTLATDSIRRAPVDSDSWGRALSLRNAMELMQQPRVDSDSAAGLLRLARRQLTLPLADLALRRGYSPFDSGRQLKQASDEGVLPQALCAETFRALNQLGVASLHADLKQARRDIPAPEFEHDLVFRLREAVVQACGGKVGDLFES